MSTATLEAGLTSLRFARHMTMSLLDAIPEQDWFHVPVDGGNHAAWIAGHVAWEDDDCLNSLVDGRGRKLPRRWHDTFATGTKPNSDPSAYPDIPELRAALTAYREELIDSFKAAADRLADPLPEGLHGFAKNLAAFMPAIACHEMIHVGQLTVIRKSLQLAPVFC